METLTTDNPLADGGAWIGHGAVAGVLGGIGWLILEVAVAALTMGAGFALVPLRMIAGILLGPGAVDPASPIIPVAIAGALVHVTLSAAFGILFAALMQRPDPVGSRPARRTWRLLTVATVYGFGLWLINFYVVAPLAGWDWFPRQTNPVVQFMAHVAVFGPLVGVYLDQIEARARNVVVPEIPEVRPRRPVRRRAA
jgi:hypothetical protein